jgi:hypothetical protein
VKPGRRPKRIATDRKVRPSLVEFPITPNGFVILVELLAGLAKLHPLARVRLAERTFT